MEEYGYFLEPHIMLLSVTFQCNIVLHPLTPKEIPVYLHMFLLKVSLLESLPLPLGISTGLSLGVLVSIFSGTITFQLHFNNN